MKTFDVIVIGGGSGLNIADAALKLGKKVAIIEEGPLGGTCLNRGCIPSKMLIHSADVAETIRNAKKFGIRAKEYSVDFSSIIKRANSIVGKESREIEKGIRQEKNFTLYKARAKFVGRKILQFGKDGKFETITAEKIFIVGGSRPLIPKIEGLGKISYLTSTEALRLKKLPKSMILLGGGYIAAELAHFFGSLGTKITIVEMAPRMLMAEDEEISQAFTALFRKKYNVLLGFVGKKVERKNGNVFLTIEKAMENNVAGKNKKPVSKTVSAEQILVAVGRVPNSDLLEVKNSGIEANEKGFVKVNEFLETNVDGVWALGDIAGIYMFKHSANLEAQSAFHNAFYPNEKRPVDYTAMPHAVFSSPQIAGVGMTEQQAKQKNIAYSVGKCFYKHTGMGEAMLEKDGFVKAIAEKGTGKILGCHIIGPEASTLIHEAIVAMKANGTIDAIKNSVHIHPALSEVVQRAFNTITI